VVLAIVRDVVERTPEHLGLVGRDDSAKRTNTAPLSPESPIASIMSSAM